MSTPNYEKLQKLGEGTYGDVYMAIDKRNGQRVALKRIKLEQEEEGIPPTSIREISILKELHHPNILELIEVINSRGKLTMVTELLDKDLKKFMEKNKSGISPELIQSYAYQIVAGLCYCHCHRIMHRDMKPQNILIDRTGFAKICDFGLARAFTIPLRNYTHEVVTLWYRAPEILLGSRYYSLPIDIWSTGCIIAEMFLNQPLFNGDSEIDQLYKIFRILGTPNEETWKGVSQLPQYSSSFPNWGRKDFHQLFPRAPPEAIDLISRMLAYDPAERISAKEALDHPYFRTVPEEVKQKCRPREIDPITTE